MTSDNIFLSLSPEKKLLMSQVCRLLQLTLVMPATNATSERSFSALRRVKNYSRTTMLQERLNYVMLLHVPRESVDLLNLKRIHNEFVEGSEHRLRMFGKYTDDLR